MSKHETPLTRRYWQDNPGTLCLEHRVIPQTKTNGYRQVDAIIWPDGPNEPVDHLDLAGKDIICVQTKAARLSVHVIGQAYFSRLLLLRHSGARSVRTVAVCTASDAVLSPIATGLGIEVAVIDGEAKGGTSLKRTPSWVSKWHQSLGNSTLYKNLRVVKRAQDRGDRSVYAIVDLDGPLGERSGRSGADLKGHDVVAITTTTGRPGMYSVGEALVNRSLLLEQCGAKSVRSIVLCGQNDSVIDPLAAEHDIEIVVMGSEAGP